MTTRCSNHATTSMTTKQWPQSGFKDDKADLTTMKWISWWRSGFHDNEEGSTATKWVQRQRDGFNTSELGDDEADPTITKWIPWQWDRFDTCKGHQSGGFNTGEMVWTPAKWAWRQWGGLDTSQVGPMTQRSNGQRSMKFFLFLFAPSPQNEAKGDP